VPCRRVSGSETRPSAASTRALKKPPTMSGCGGGSVAPTTTAFASPRRMASIASLRATPKVEHAATGAKARPVILPSIENLRRRRVVDVPHDVGRDLPRRVRRAPLLLQLAAGGVAGPDDVHLAAVDAAGDASLFDLRQRGQVLAQLGRAIGPVAVPGVDGGLAILRLGVDRSCRGRSGRNALDRGAAVALEVSPQGAVARRLGPEPIQRRCALCSAMLAS
jgi:hypothetical protein